MIIKNLNQFTNRQQYAIVGMYKTFSFLLSSKRVPEYITIF